MFWCANFACLCIHCIDCNEKTIHGTLDLINGTLETTVNGTRSWISCIRFYIWYQYSEYKAFTFYIIILEWLYVLAFSSTGSRTSFIILKLYVKKILRTQNSFICLDEESKQSCTSLKYPLPYTHANFRLKFHYPFFCYYLIHSIKVIFLFFPYSLVFNEKKSKCPKNLIWHF